MAAAVVDFTVFEGHGYPLEVGPSKTEEQWWTVDEAD
jgi:hypothetical protein